jgi:hypothetical protein
LENTYFWEQILGTFEDALRNYLFRDRDCGPIRLMVFAVAADADLL